MTREQAYPWYSTAEDGASCADYRHYRADANDYSAADYWGASGSPQTNGPVGGDDYDIDMISVIWWSDPPGTDTFPTAGGDYDPDHYPVSDNYYNVSYGTREFDFDVTESVQAMVNNLIDNNGWYIRTHGGWDHLDFFTSEYGEQGVSPSPAPEGALGFRPELIVTYEPITCGNSIVPHPAGDISGPNDVRDCYNDMYDLAAMADQWLRCTTPDSVGCEQVAELFLIGHDTVTVNADLTEWGDATWLALDETYFGDPNDIGAGLENAKFAVKWNADTDKVYAVVIIDDANHVLADYPTNWDSCDRIEVYAQGDPNGGTLVGYR